MVMQEYLDAKKTFLNGDFSSVLEFFTEHDFLLEEAYCELFLGNFDKAIISFTKLKEIDIRADWALKIIQFIKNEIQILPSYFQIRNFLEIDLHFLIVANLKEAVENVINGADLFFGVNPESYKFIARVLVYHGYDGIAFHYLKKAKDKFYYDPEMHLLLAGCFYRAGEISLAKKSANSCLSILPNYYPAKKMLATLNNI